MSVALSVVRESWHGTQSGYAYHKCRCEDCKEAVRAAKRSRAARRREDGFAGKPRGERVDLTKAVKLAAQAQQRLADIRAKYAAEMLARAEDMEAEAMSLIEQAASLREEARTLQEA